MKRVMIFIGLKVAEVIGVATSLYVLWLFSKWVNGLDTENEIFSWILLGIFCALVLTLIVIWVKANWKWATKLSKKGE